VTQKSKSQRERRRRRWFDQERPTLLVRLRLVGTAEDVDSWKDTKLKQAQILRAYVHYREHYSLNPTAERS
jgi:hypothetical protein